jgi:hypothetical protein
MNVLAVNTSSKSSEPVEFKEKIPLPTQIPVEGSEGLDNETIIERDRVHYFPYPKPQRHSAPLGPVWSATITKRLSIINLIGPNCITIEDGEKIYDQIYPEVIVGNPVNLDFAGVKLVSSPFLNTAIGQLLNHFTRQDIKECLKVINLEKYAKDMLELVLENSERYYHDPDFKEAVDKVLKERVENE